MAVALADGWGTEVREQRVMSTGLFGLDYL